MEPALHQDVCRGAVLRPRVRADRGDVDALQSERDERARRLRREALALVAWRDTVRDLGDAILAGRSLESRAADRQRVVAVHDGEAEGPRIRSRRHAKLLHPGW